MKTINVNDEVVRAKGDYVVGRVGRVVAVDMGKQRAQVQWNGETKTWVAFLSLELTSIPYIIIPTKYDDKGRRVSWPKYERI